MIPSPRNGLHLGLVLLEVPTAVITQGGLSTKNNLINKFPRKFESLSSISDEASDLVMFNLSEFAWELYIEDVNKITGAMATQAAKDHIHPEKFLIVVVGDRKKIQNDIESLNLSLIHI